MVSQPIFIPEWMIAALLPVRTVAAAEVRLVVPPFEDKMPPPVVSWWWRRRRSWEQAVAIIFGLDHGSMGIDYDRRRRW
jgi:hypothetical protein